MSNSRRKYDEKFKKRAVRMSYSSERTVTKVAESLGITSNMIYRWRKKYTPEGDKTQIAQQHDELSQLRHRIAELEEENYILKKASAFFAKKSKVTKTDCYSLMKDESKYAKMKWAEKLGVSTSGYYTWLDERNQRQETNELLRSKVISIFNESKGMYGAERICGILRRDGQLASYRCQAHNGARKPEIMPPYTQKRCLTDSRKARGV